jgi:hypothetical protein
VAKGSATPATTPTYREWGLGFLFPYTAVNITVLCAVFTEEGAGAEFQLADTHSLKKLFLL